MMEENPSKKLIDNFEDSCVFLFKNEVDKDKKKIIADIMKLKYAGGK